MNKNLEELAKEYNKPYQTTLKDYQSHHKMFYDAFGNKKNFDTAKIHRMAFSSLRRKYTKQELQGISHTDQVFLKRLQSMYEVPLTVLTKTYRDLKSLTGEVQDKYLIKVAINESKRRNNHE